MIPSVVWVFYHLNPLSLAFQSSDWKSWFANINGSLVITEYQIGEFFVQHTKIFQIFKLGIAVMKICVPAVQLSRLRSVFEAKPSSVLLCHLMGWV